MIATARKVTGNVKRWRNGSMKLPLPVLTPPHSSASSPGAMPGDISKG